MLDPYASIADTPPPYQYPIFSHLRCTDDTAILDRERYGLVSYFHTKDNP